MVSLQIILTNKGNAAIEKISMGNVVRRPKSNGRRPGPGRRECPTAPVFGRRRALAADRAVFLWCGCADADRRAQRRGPAVLGD